MLRGAPAVAPRSVSPPPAPPTPRRLAGGGRGCPAPCGSGLLAVCGAGALNTLGLFAARARTFAAPMPPRALLCRQPPRARGGGWRAARKRAGVGRLRRPGSPGVLNVLPPGGRRSRLPRPGYITPRPGCAGKGCARLRRPQRPGRCAIGFKPGSPPSRVPAGGAAAAGRPRRSAPWARRGAGGGAPFSRFSPARLVARAPPFSPPPPPGRARCAARRALGAFFAPPAGAACPCGGI